MLAMSASNGPLALISGDHELGHPSRDRHL